MGHRRQQIPAEAVQGGCLGDVQDRTREIKGLQQDQQGFYEAGRD